MIRRTLMGSTLLDEWMITSHVRCIYMHVAEPEDRWRSVPHAHEYNEICYVAQGSGKYQIDGVDYSMNANDIFLLPKGCMHGENQESWESYELRFLMVETRGEHAQDLNEYFFSAPARFRSDKPYEIRRLFEQIMQEVIEYQDGYLSVVENTLKSLFVLLWRQKETENARDKLKNAESSLHCRDFLAERVRSWVLDNLEHDFTIDEIAHACHYHPKYLTTLIKRETGRTLSQYILSIRLDRACALLVHTQYVTSSIITMCGFTNNSHFYKCFRQYTGMTPQQYRNSRRNAPRDEFGKSH